MARWILLAVLALPCVSQGVVLEDLLVHASERFGVSIFLHRDVASQSRLDPAALADARTVAGLDQVLAKAGLVRREVRDGSWLIQRDPLPVYPLPQYGIDRGDGRQEGLPPAGSVVVLPGTQLPDHAGASLADTFQDMANVYGSGSRIYIRGVARNRFASPSDIPVFWDELPLPDFLLDVAPMASGIIDSVTVRRGAAVTTTANPEPGYGGSVHLQTRAHPAPDSRARLAVTAEGDAASSLMHGLRLGAHGGANLGVFGERRERPFDRLVPDDPPHSRTRGAYAGLWWQGPKLTAALKTTVIEAHAGAEAVVLEGTSFDFDQHVDAGVLETGARRDIDAVLVSATLGHGASRPSGWKLSAGLLDAGEISHPDPTAPFAETERLQREPRRVQVMFEGWWPLWHGRVHLAVGASNLDREQQSLRVQSITTDPLFPHGIIAFTGDALVGRESRLSLDRDRRTALVGYSREQGDWHYGAGVRLDQFSEHIRGYDGPYYASDGGCSAQAAFSFDFYGVFLEPGIDYRCDQVLPDFLLRESDDTDSTSDRHLTPWLQIARRFDRSHWQLAYLEGFRPGGFVRQRVDGNPVLFPYRAEESHSLELTHTLSLARPELDSRLTAFFTRYTDQQIPLLPGEGDIGHIHNAGRSAGYGLEWEASWNPTPADRLRWSLGWLHTRHERFVPFEQDSDATMGTTGNRFAGAPEWSGAISYDHAVNSRHGLGIRLTFAGAAHANANNIAGGEAPAFHRLDLAYRWQFSRGAVVVQLLNATDERYLATTAAVRTITAPPDGITTVVPAPPRTLGLQLSFDL